MKIFIKTYGCSANQNNSEIIAGILESKKHVIVPSIGEAEAVIINSCIVKGPTEQKIIKEILRLQKTKKRLIITGCMPEAEISVLKKIAPNSSLVGMHHITLIEKAVRQKKIYIGYRRETKLRQPKKTKNPAICIIQISEGCMNRCSYCIVRIAKGALFSYPEKEIIMEARQAVSTCPELWLTSQDNAAFNLEHGRSKLPSLLNNITKLQGDFFVRVGMMNPDTILRILTNLISAYKSEKIFKFLHIPVQSGNNRILSLMGRKYNVKQFKMIIKRFRQAFPDITIATDIICGFPTETDNEFMDSLKLIKEIQPDVLNISRFWPRPGTKAAELPQLSGRITKKRSRILASEFNRICLNRNKQRVGWIGKILIDNKGRGNSWIGRNSCYRPVIVVSKKRLLGKSISVKITRATKNYLIGALQN